MSPGKHETPERPFKYIVQPLLFLRHLRVCAKASLLWWSFLSHRPFFLCALFQTALSTSLCFINQHLKILARGSGHPFHESLGLIPRFFPVFLFPCYVLRSSFPVFTSLIYCFISKAAMKIIRGNKLTCLPFHSGMMISTVCLFWKKNKEPDLYRKR